MSSNKSLEETVYFDPILASHGDDQHIAQTQSRYSPDTGRLSEGISTPSISTSSSSYDLDQVKPQNSSNIAPKRRRSNIAPKTTRSRKRMRVIRQSVEDVESRTHQSPSPSLPSDDEDDLDEADATSSVEQHASVVTEHPKKKRTRTLTTPHQSSVLHGLLSQSRFPTTAMREEVGRQIGLSPRKVQVWFQNQRQKAKKPKGDSETPLTRVPQFGPFPGTEFIQGSSHYSDTSHVEGIHPSHDAHRFQVSPHHTANVSTRSPLAASRVRDPGFFRELPQPQTTRQQYPSGLATVPSEMSDYLHTSPHSSTSPHAYSRFSRDVDPPIILPPLPSVPGRQSASTASGLPAVGLLFRDPGSSRTNLAPSSRGSTPHFSAQMHSISQSSISSHTLPPPFALQPTPQWSEDLSPLQLSSRPRRGSSAISDVPTAGPSRLSAVAPQPTRNTENLGLSPIHRHRRFDPVRAAESMDPQVVPNRPYSQSSQKSSGSEKKYS